MPIQKSKSGDIPAFIYTLPILIILLVLSNQSWASLFLRKTEPVTLSEDNLKSINIALEALEQGLSDKINLESVKAERYANEEYPVFFKQGYQSGPVDETYTHFKEVRCEYSPEKDKAWQCKNNGNAIQFISGNSQQTVWIENITTEFGIKIIEFLKTGPEYECNKMQIRKPEDAEKSTGPCMQSFDKEQLKTVQSIRKTHSYSREAEHVDLQVGNHRNHPSLVYNIEPAQCDENPCSLKITSSSMIMY